MKFLSFTALATLASAASLDLTKRDSPLDVKLETVGNTAVKASIKNTGATDLKVFKVGTILEKTPTEKVDVFQGESKVAFSGIRLRLQTTSIEESAFQTIAAGETVTADFDIAELHDLSQGGVFDVVSSGALSVAKPDSTELTDSVPFTSNTLKVTVNGAEAGAVHKNFHDKRTAVQSDCTGSQRTAVTTALSNCRSLASAAATAAQNNNAKMTEYFKSSAASTKSTVAGVFNRIVSECGSTTSGASRTYCTDVYSNCGSNVIAYTVPSASVVVYCPIFFNSLPALTSTCHAQDRATTVLHETTHLTQIKGTQDYNGYGYSFVRSLSAAQNLNHADTYALFSNAIYLGC